MGVMAPSLRCPESTSAYSEPEKSRLPPSRSAAAVGEGQTAAARHAAPECTM